LLFSYNVWVSDNTDLIGKCGRLPSLTLLSNILRSIGGNFFLKIGRIWQWIHIGLVSSLLVYSYFTAPISSLVIGQFKQLTASWVNIDRSHESTNLSIPCWYIRLLQYKLLKYSLMVHWFYCYCDIPFLICSLPTKQN
jgi:hypothetical protein